MAEVGDLVASALDTAYSRYCGWCEERGLPIADYSVWVKQEFEGMGMKRLLSHAETQKRRQAIGPQPQPTAI
jgi:hypothetical protein